jgi:uncharacterized protein YndB with AHSA1/START domain
MTFPDRIERTIELTQPPAKVWAAITTPEGLSSWFGDEATLDLQPGGTGQLRWSDGGTIPMRIERVEEPKVFAFSWLHDLPGGGTGDTYVEFSLEPAGSGTQLRMVESGFAQLPEEYGRTQYAAHDEGWTNELGELADYLHG